MMSLPIIDAHCHLDSYKKIEISKGWLPVTVGHSNSSNIKNAAIAEKYKIPLVLGIAPQTAVKEGISNLNAWIDEIKKHKTILNAIGEIGLDFHWAKNPDEIKNEKILFERMLLLAEEMKLPIVIHSRKAEKKVLEILREHGWNSKIMMHFFSGTLEDAEKTVEFGAFISISPLHSKEKRKIINSIGLENLLVESDSPYVMRSFYDVERAIEYIAEIKALDKEIVAHETAKNAIRFFNI